MVNVDFFCKSGLLLVDNLWVSLQKLHFFALTVQNLCKNMWVKLWERRGKNFCFLWINNLYTILAGKLGLFHGLVEKFSLWFYTRFYRGKMAVLHSFHRPYYYYY